MQPRSACAARCLLPACQRDVLPVGGHALLGVAAAVQICVYGSSTRAAGRHVYFEQIRVLKAGSNVAGCACVLRCTALNMVAWNNGTRPRSRLYAVLQRVNVALVAVPCAGCRSRSRIRVRVARSSLRGCVSVTVRGLRIVGANLGCWSVFGTGGNDQQRQAWAFVPRR